MYNPERMDMYTRAAILNALMDMNGESWVEEGDGYCYNQFTHEVDREIAKNMCGDSVLDEILMIHKSLFRFRSPFLSPSGSLYFLTLSGFRSSFQK